MGAAEGKSPVKKYWIICAVLFVITLLEYWVFKDPSLRDNSAFMYPVLGIMSLIKFVLVCGWYMHLKGDHPLLTKIFLSGLGLALIVMLIYVFSMPPMGATG